VGEAPNPLEGTANGAREGEKFFEQLGFKMATELVNEEKIEANSSL
jgi:hypothetical protein